MRFAASHHAFRFLLIALVGALLLALSDHVHARDFKVTRTDDQFDGVCDSQCSLRDAVAAANQLGGSNRILLPAGRFGTTLAPPRGDDGQIFDEDANLNGDFDISGGTLAVIGAGTAQTVIDGGGVDRIFEVAAGASVTLQDLTLENGRTSTAGAAVQNFGTLLVRRVLFQENLAFDAFGRGEGGAIANLGTLEVYNSTFRNNRADFGDSGHAWGGAIFSSGNLFVRDSLFRDNITNGDDVVALGGAIFNTGNADVARSAFLLHRSDGPGIVIRNDGNGVFKLTNVTISGKNAIGERDNDSVVANGSYFPMFSGTPSMTLINVTIADNLALGVLNYGRLTVRNSLIAGNGNESIGVSNCLNGPNASYQARGLLLGADTGNCTADLLINDAETFTKVLYPLADNNSPLPTHALLPNSPAVDAGVGSCTSHDQRGSMRPRDGNNDGVAVCDLGAYERPAKR